jgi:glutathione synthase/RimK-type ligase-like ATP-grasp enzyme
MNTVIVTSAGGPVAENVIQSLKLAENILIVGTDTDRNMLLLSSADEKAVVHHSSEATDMYVDDINKLATRHNATMLIPVSDREIYVAALNGHRLPSMSIPSLKIVETCRNKAKLYDFMKEHGFPVPFTIYPLSYHYYSAAIRDLKRPMWLRATIGAGGWLAHRVESLEDIKALLRFYRNTKREFMLSEYLAGRNYCWTSLWVDGKLACSVTKERLEWVYQRIGTTAVQRIVHNRQVSKLCEEVVECLVNLYADDMTALMMVDLKENPENGVIHITEINAGRAGTVSMLFTLGSQLAYNDQRVNFHHQLSRAHHGLKLLPCEKRDALPEEMTYTRHIDMGSVLTWKDKQVKYPVCWGKEK